MLTITLMRFLGLWLFSAMIYLLNQTMLPDEYQEIKKKVEALVDAGEVDLEEVRPEFVRGMMLLDMILRTGTVSAFCVMSWNTIL
jgi:hypothetical protein